MQVFAYIGSSSQWFILAIVFLVVFGANRLPDLARNLGKSLGILKKAKREFEDELLRSQTPESATPAAEPEELKAQASATAATDQPSDTTKPTA